MKNLIIRLVFGPVPLTKRGPRAILWLLLGALLSGMAVAQTNVTFPDPNLEAAIRSALSKPQNPLTLADLQGLTCLAACNRQITNLSGLEAASNLTGLYLSGNVISDLTPLQGLSQLGTLELEKNNLSDLSPLAGLTDLSCLALGGNYPANYSILSNLTNLSSLSIRSGSMTRLTPLRNLNRLSSLVLWDNGIRNTTSLAGLTNLSCLDLRWNSISNLVLPPNLTSLYLGGNPLSNVPSLTQLSQLRLLNLDDDQIGDLSPLMGLSNLVYLALNRNVITNCQVLANLTGLISLELRGNAISNLDFMVGLRRLGYADLAYNSVTSLTPLGGLTNLNSLVLAGNSLVDLSPLYGMPNVTNLWLFDNAISNADFVASLRWLNHLNLEGNQIANLPNLVAITNLTGLGFSRNPVADYSPAAVLTNLSALRLEGCRLTNLAFLTNLTALEFLSLDKNRIADLSPLVRLTNLHQLYLQRNALSGIQPLTNDFPRLLTVDLSQNCLDLTTGSSASSVIQSLQYRTAPLFQCACALGTNAAQATQCQRVQVIFLPTNQPPIISAPSSWFVPANADSTFASVVSEEPLPEDGDFVVTASSSDTNRAMILGSPLPGTDFARTLTVAAGAPGASPVTLRLAVTDDVGLSNSTAIEAFVVTPISLTNLLSAGVTNLDSNFEAAIRATLGKFDGELTSVDLLNLTNLSVSGADLSGFFGWQWATNITSLFLSGNSILDLSALTNLPHLASLSLYNNGVIELSAISNLTSLQQLSVSGDPLSNYDMLASMTNLASLDLADNGLTNLDFLHSLTQLCSLNLYGNAVRDLSPLAGMQDLSYLEVGRNMVSDISSLANLPMLAYAGLAYNVLDFSSNSPAINAIQALTNRGVAVPPLPDDLPPQREPPSITIGDGWVVPAGQASCLYFNVSDEGVAAGDEVSLIVSSSNTNLVSNGLGGVPVVRYTNDFTIDWYLVVTPASNQVGTTTLTLAATNAVGLGVCVPVLVTVAAPLSLDGSFFGTTNLAWQTGGDVPWFGQTALSFGGGPTAQSGQVGDFGISWLQASVVGPGTLTFWWKVSSETNCDWLEFDLGPLTNRISGEVDWQQEVVFVPIGPQTLVWRYWRDSAVAQGTDSGWLGEVSFVPESWLEVAGKPANGRCQLNLHGVPGQHYQVQYSTNLVGWSLLNDLILTNNVVPVMDTGAVSQVRFFRMKTVAP